MLKSRLEDFHNNLKKTAAIVKLMLTQSVKAVKNKDDRLAKNVMNADEVLGGEEMERDNLTRGTRIIARFQPTASDMRMLVGGILINSYLDRIAKHSLKMSRKVERYIEVPDESIPPIFFRGLDFGERMFNNCISAMLNESEVKASKVLVSEFKMDEIAEQIEGEVLANLCVGPTSPDVKMNIIHITRNIERVGDLSVNIAKIVLFIIGSDLYFKKTKEILEEVG